MSRFYYFILCTLFLQNSFSGFCKNSTNSGAKPITKDNSPKTFRFSSCKSSEKPMNNFATNQFDTLHSSQIVYLKGVISDEVVDAFLTEFQAIPNKEDIVVYIDSPGGSVIAGNKIITLLENYPVTCIAEKAYSMGFAIFQSCKNRLVLEHSTLMQHQMFALVGNELEKMNHYLEFLNDINDILTEKQSKRIGMPSKTFKEKTYNDWWLTAKKAVKENVADAIVSFLVV